MVDSTNPRIMANNIRELSDKIAANDVEGNPSGSGFNTLLTKIKIDSKKFKLPNQVEANPAGEATDALEKISIGSSIFSLAGGAEVKSFTFTGDGESSVDIEFEEKPTLIWFVGFGNGSDAITCSGIFTPESYGVFGWWFYQSDGVPTSKGGDLFCLAVWDDTDNTLTLSGGSDAGHRYNVSGKTTTVYYI